MLVSVVMSVFNESQQEIEESIRSILKQTYSNIELLIINDNPNDMSLKKFLNSYTDERIKIIENKKNIGLGLSLNKGIALAKGEYIARMDADDISKCDRIEKQIRYLKKNRDIVLLGTDAIKIDEKGIIIGELISDKKYISKLLNDKNCFIHPTIIFRKSFVEKIGGYRDFPCAQDYDLYSRIIYHKGKVANLNEKLLYYRVRKNSISSQKELLQLLIGKYIKALNKERKVNGNDTFSSFKIKELVHEFEENKQIFNLQKEKLRKAKKFLIKYIFILIQLFFISKYFRFKIYEKIKNKFSNCLYKLGV